MELVLPILLLLAVASAALVAPAVVVFWRRMLFGFAVLRSEMRVRAAQALYKERSR